MMPAPADGVADGVGLVGGLGGDGGVRNPNLPPPSRQAEAEHAALAILRLSSFELRNRLDVPYRVVINEAVELAKTFGGVEGFRYVNGVLDRAAVEWRKTESSQ